MGKASRVIVTARIHDVLRLILAGAEFADIRKYADDHGWHVGERQMRRYIEAAHAQFADATGRNRAQLLGRHVMQRHMLLARALQASDLKTALHVLRDEAELLGLYPPTKIAPTTPDGERSYQPELLYERAIQELTIEELRSMTQIKRKLDCSVRKHENEIESTVRRHHPTGD